MVSGADQITAADLAIAIAVNMHPHGIAPTGIVGFHRNGKRHGLSHRRRDRNRL
jgi:hypothetical protein